MTRPRWQQRAAQFPIPWADVRRLIDGARTVETRILFRLLAECGLRREEAAGLEIGSLDLPAERIRVLGKRNKIRIVPMPASLAAEIRLYLGGRRRGYLFPGRDGRGFRFPTWVNRSVALEARRLGVSNPNPERRHLNPHALRHSYARRLKDRGVPLEAIRDVLGHDSIQMTMDWYGRMSADQVAEEVRNGIGG